MQTAPYVRFYGFDNFCTLSLQDVSCDAALDSRARPARSCSSISSQLCARLWKRNMSPQTRHSDPKWLHRLPCRHTGVPLPASGSCLPFTLPPSLPSVGAQPALLLGEASELSPGSGSIRSAFPHPTKSLVTCEPQGPHCPLPPSLLIPLPILQAPRPRCLCPEGTSGGGKPGPALPKHA